jgi:hypothetical protein
MTPKRRSIVRQVIVERATACGIDGPVYVKSMKTDILKQPWLGEESGLFKRSTGTGDSHTGFLWRKSRTLQCGPLPDGGQETQQT